MISPQRIEDQLLECQEKPKWGKNKGQALQEAKDKNEVDGEYHVGCIKVLGNRLF